MVKFIGSRFSIWMELSLIVLTDTVRVDNGSRKSTLNTGAQIWYRAMEDGILPLAQHYQTAWGSKLLYHYRNCAVMGMRIGSLSRDSRYAQSFFISAPKIPQYLAQN